MFDMLKSEAKEQTNVFPSRMLEGLRWNSNAILFNGQKWWPVDPACSPDERCNDSFFLHAACGERE